MSFDARESSIAAGQPIRLYEFALGATLRWRHTNADRDIEHDGKTFATSAISDDGIRQTGQASADMLVITAPANLAVAQRFRALPPSAEIALTIWDIHYDDDEAVVSWVGSIAMVRWPQLDRCQISCEPLGVSMQRTGLRMTYQRSCPHSLGDRLCTVDLEVYRVEATIKSMTGATIVCHGWGDLPIPLLTWLPLLAGGYVEWLVDGEPERRGITAQQAGFLDTTLTLMGGTAGLQVGDVVQLYPGCPGTLAACNDVYDNLLNYGGFPHIPGRSPFDGNPIF